MFTAEELANTPSVQDGMKLAEERDLRAKGLNFIVQVGILLKLPQLTLSTAAIFFQRFLMRASLKAPRDGIPKLHHYQSAAVALFLATKVEESCRKMKEIVLACCRVAQKNPNLVIDEQSKDFWKWRDCILHNEDVMLEVLCFDLTVESPHRQLFDMLKWYGQHNDKKLRNAAWAFVTDSANTQLCLLCSSRTIAAAAFYNACRYSDAQIPDDKHGRPWWEGAQVRLSDVRKAVEYMAAHFEEVSGKDSSGVAKTAAPDSGAPSSDGGKSIYLGASTPMEGLTEDFDATRLKQSRQNGAVNSPVPQSQGLVPGAGERRVSNASSVGIKRERDDTVQSNGNANGTPRPQESKRHKTETNGNDGVETKFLQHSNVENDLRLDEEKQRVQSGNQMNEKDVAAAPALEAKDEGEVSEEGEVEE